MRGLLSSTATLVAWTSRLRRWEHSKTDAKYSPVPVLWCHVQLVEAIVLPMTHKERFENIGVHPPKGTFDSSDCGVCTYIHTCMRIQVCCYMVLLELARHYWRGPVQHRPRWVGQGGCICESSFISPCHVTAVDLPQVSWASVGSGMYSAVPVCTAAIMLPHLDVHWRRSQDGERCICIGQGEGSCDYFH